MLKKENSIEKECTAKIGKSIGAYIHLKREEKGISVRNFAKKFGFSSTLVSDFENGVKIPRLESILKMLLVLEIPFDDIFTSKVLPAEYINKRKKGSIDLPQLLVKQGLSNQEIKEIQEYIEFKKLIRKKK